MFVRGAPAVEDSHHESAIGFDGATLAAQVHFQNPFGLRRVNVYTRNDNGLTQVDTLESGQLGDWFGTSISVDGDTMIVSARWNEDDQGSTHSAVYVFERNGSGVWTDVAALQAPGTFNGFGFGSRIAAGGDFFATRSKGDDFQTDSATSVFSFDQLACPTLAGSVTQFIAAFLSLSAGGSADFDPDLFFTLTSPNSATLSSSLGFLDGSGRATFSFHVPPASNPILVGAKHFHAAVAIDPVTAAITRVSNPVGGTLVP